MDKVTNILGVAAVFSFAFFVTFVFLFALFKLWGAIING
jgi:hypothetical protein